MYRTSLLVRNAVRWCVSGTLLAILLLAAISLVAQLLGRNDPGATWAGAVGAAFVYPGITMLAGAPLTAAALIGWLTLAQRFPVIENYRVLRTLGLVLLGVLVAQVGLALWLVVDGEMRSIEEVVVRLRSSTDAVSFVTTGYVACVVLPRLILARLRKPSMDFTLRFQRASGRVSACDDIPSAITRAAIISCRCAALVPFQGALAQSSDDKAADSSAFVTVLQQVTRMALARVSIAPRPLRPDPNITAVGATSYADNAAGFVEARQAQMLRAGISVALDVTVGDCPPASLPFQGPLPRVYPPCRSLALRFH